MSRDHLFGKGNPGKPKGALNKTTKLVKEVFADAFNELQQDEAVKLAVWGKENPTEFYKLASKLIPTQMDIAANVNLSDQPIVFE
jgi:hypothetical protein